jgi:hypothetical protein
VSSGGEHMFQLELLIKFQAGRFFLCVYMLSTSSATFNSENVLGKLLTGCERETQINHFTCSEFASLKSHFRETMKCKQAARVEKKTSRAK